MVETKYNIEILFNNTKKWQYVNQQSSLEWAMKIAQRPYYQKAGKVRIRKVIKEIVWKSKGNPNAYRETYS